MGNKCACGKRISGKATHCNSCARLAGGYHWNMAAELAAVQRKADAAASLAAAKEAAKKQERQKKIAERAAAAKAADQKRQAAARDRVQDIKTARKISNARNRPEPEPKKKGWW